MYPGSTTDADSPCLLVKGAGCAGVCLAVLAWLCPGLSRVLFLGSHGALEHVNVAVRTCPVLCGVPRGFGGDSLPHIPATRAMFAYPSESASSTVCGGGKTAHWSSCRLHVKVPHANRRGGTGIIVADACAFHLSNSLVALSEEHCPSTYDGKVSHVPALCCLPSVGAVQCPDSGVPVVLE